MNPRNSGGMISWPHCSHFPDQKVLRISSGSFLSLPVPLYIPLPQTSNISVANSSQPIIDSSLWFKVKLYWHSRVAVWTILLQHTPNSPSSHGTKHVMINVLTELKRPELYPHPLNAWQSLCEDSMSWLTVAIALISEQNSSQCIALHVCWPCLLIMFYFSLRSMRIAQWCCVTDGDMGWFWFLLWYLKACPDFPQWAIC